MDWVPSPDRREAALGGQIVRADLAVARSCSVCSCGSGRPGRPGRRPCGLSGQLADALSLAWDLARSEGRKGGEMGV